MCVCIYIYIYKYMYIYIGHIASDISDIPFHPLCQCLSKFPPPRGLLELRHVAGPADAHGSLPHVRFLEEMVNY